MSDYYRWNNWSQQMEPCTELGTPLREAVYCAHCGEEKVSLGRCPCRETR